MKVCEKRSNFFKYLYPVVLLISFVALFLVFSEPTSAALTSWSTYLSNNGLTTVAYAGGNGSSSSPYLISTPLQLARLAYDTNRGISTSGKYYKLIQNIDVSGYNGTSLTWTPIGNSSYSFKGTFWGDGCTVTGLNIDTDLTTYQGLFGYVSGATISEVVLGEGSIEVSTTSGCGAVVGYATTSTITKCVNDKTTISGTYTSTTNARIGGIVGYTYGTTSIENCINHASVTISGGANCTYYVGGIVGYFSGSISYCLNYGSVSSILSGNYSSAVHYVGGIAGRALNSVNYCGNLANITGGDSYASTSYVGGISGYSVNNINYCYNRGSISSSARTQQSDSTITTPSKETLLTADTTKSFQLNSFKDSSSFDQNFKSYIRYNTEYAYAGGISGYCNATVNDCYNTSSVSGGIRTGTLYYYFSLKYSEPRGGNSSSGMVPKNSVMVRRITLNFIDNYYYESINGKTSQSVTNSFGINQNLATTLNYSLAGYGVSSTGRVNYSGTYTNIDTKSTTGSYTYDTYSNSDPYIDVDAIINFQANSFAVSIKYTWQSGKDETTTRDKSLYSGLTWDPKKGNYTVKTTTELKSLSSTPLSSSVWAVSSAINDGYPHIKNMLWNDNTSSFN